MTHSFLVTFNPSVYLEAEKCLRDASPGWNPADAVTTIVSVERKSQLTEEIRSAQDRVRHNVNKQYGYPEKTVIHIGNVVKL